MLHICIPWSRKEHPLPTFNFLYKVKVCSNERPSWSELHMANEVHKWSLRSTSPISMHIRNFVLYFIEGYAKQLCADKHSLLMQCALGAKLCLLGAIQSIVCCRDFNSKPLVAPLHVRYCCPIICLSQV